MTLGTNVLVELWNSFPEELKTTKQKIISINVTKDLSDEEKQT